MRAGLVALICLGLAALHGARATDAPEPALAVARALERGDTAAMREALAAHARATSLDEAAELFARTLDAVPRNRAFRVRYERALADPLWPARASSHELFLLVPGWRYRTDPATGADLARVHRVLEDLGLETRLVPIDENDTVEANAVTLAAEIERLLPEGRRLILVSTSKGGAETHLALDRLRQAGRAGHVAAWVNIGGLLHGTAIADYWDTWPRSWLAAIGFAFRGHHTRAIPTMATAASRARIAASQLPAHVVVVNYLAVTRERRPHRLDARQLRDPRRARAERRPDAARRRDRAAGDHRGGARLRPLPSHAGPRPPHCGDGAVGAGPPPGRRHLVARRDAAQGAAVDAGRDVPSAAAW